MKMKICVEGVKAEVRDPSQVSCDALMNVVTRLVTRRGKREKRRAIDETERERRRLRGGPLLKC